MIYYRDKLNFKGDYNTRSIDKIDRIVIHHSVGNTDQTPEEVHQVHLDRGWSGAAYHFFINDKGIYVLNHFDKLTYHCKNYNTKSIGICIAGNFNNSILTDWHKYALCEVVNAIEKLIGQKKLYYHGELRPTECCGDNLIEFVKQIRER